MGTTKQRVQDELQSPERQQFKARWAGGSDVGMELLSIHWKAKKGGGEACTFCYPGKLGVVIIWWTFKNMQPYLVGMDWWYLGNFLLHVFYILIENVRSHPRRLCLFIEPQIDNQSACCFHPLKHWYYQILFLDSLLGKIEQKLLFVSTCIYLIISKVEHLWYTFQSFLFLLEWPHLFTLFSLMCRNSLDTDNIIYFVWHIL